MELKQEGILFVVGPLTVLIVPFMELKLRKDTTLERDKES